MIFGLVIFTIFIIASKPAMADIVHIERDFYVYNAPVFGAQRIAMFEPQNVNVIEYGELGWAKINSSFGDVWLRLYEPQNSLEGRVIILDAGHGIENSPRFANYVESVKMLELAFLIKDLLEAQGATVLLTRTNQHDIHLTQRVAQINIWSLEYLRQIYTNALHIALHDDNQTHYIVNQIWNIEWLINEMQNVLDDWQQYAPIYFNFPFDRERETAINPVLHRIFQLQANPIISDNFLMISLHSNATGTPVNTAIHGVDIYHMSNDNAASEYYFANYANVDANRNFAEILIDNIDRIGIERRYIRQGNFFIIREHNLPSVLVENGFHTNEANRTLLMEPWFLARLAEAYEDAIIRYFVVDR